MSAKNTFFRKTEENEGKKKASVNNLRADIIFYQQETQRLLDSVERWFSNVPVKYNKGVYSLTEPCAPDVIYHMPAMTFLNNTKHLNIIPLGMYCFGGIKGRLLVSLFVNGNEKKLFECRLNDSRANFDGWAIIDVSNKKKISPFNMNTFFEYIWEFA